MTIKDPPMLAPITIPTKDGCVLSLIGDDEVVDDDNRVGDDNGDGVDDDDCDGVVNELAWKLVIHV